MAVFFPTFICCTIGFYQYITSFIIIIIIGRDILNRPLLAGGMSKLSFSFLGLFAFVHDSIALFRSDRNNVCLYNHDKNIATVYVHQWTNEEPQQVMVCIILQSHNTL